MNKFLLVIFALGALAYVAVSCLSGNEKDYAAEVTLPDSVRGDSLAIEPLDSAVAARRDSLRTDSINRENRMMLTPYKFFTSDVERALRSIGFDTDYDAADSSGDPAAGHVAVSLARHFNNRRINVSGAIYDDIKAFDIIISDPDERRAFIRQLDEMGLQKRGNLYFENSSRGSYSFRIDSIKIVFTSPWRE